MQVEETFGKSCPISGVPHGLPFLTASLSMFLAITNIPCNLLIITAVVIDPNKNLRSPFNWLITNLAVTDLTVGAIIGPMSTALHIKEGLSYEITPQEFVAMHVIYFITCTASVCSLCTLAVERYLAVNNPHSYWNRFSRKRIFLTIAGIWLFSICLPQIYFEVGYITYAFVFANTLIVVAIFITCFVYSLVLVKVKLRTQSAVKENEYGPQISSSPLHVNAPNALISNARLMETKLTKMFVVLLIAVLCCYGPSTIMIYIMSFCESCSCSTLHWLRDMQFILVTTNSNVNFFCYALNSVRFRNAFRKLLKIKNRREKPHDTINVVTAL